MLADRGQWMKRWGIALLILLILVLMVACDLLDPSRVVQFYASTTSGLLTGNYFIETDGVINNFIEASSPWSVEIDGNKGDYVILTVGGDEDVTARIYVDGTLFKEKVGTFVIQIAGYLE